MKTKKKTVRALPKDCSCAAPPTSGAARFAEIGVMLIVVLAMYQLGKYFNVFSFASAAENTFGLGAIFLIGLTASTSSCLAMVGGLLLSVSSSWAASHPKASAWERFEPQLHFNIGRLIGYFAFGGLTGVVGRQLLLSIHATGMLKIGLSAVMIFLALHILGFIPKRYCRMPLPKPLLKRIRDLSSSDGVLTPLALGSLTYFVPCGFTQSVQIIALGSGTFLNGSIIMFVFALGTLPSLLGISVLSSVLHGKVGRIFATFAGSVSLLLGLSSLQSGLLLAGVDVPFPRFTETAMMASEDPNVTIDSNGQQIISVNVESSGYNAHSFTIKADTPTWIYATAPEAVTGCISSFTIPDFNISKLIRKGANWIGPITPTKDFAFMCSMGMFKANVHVQS